MARQAKRIVVHGRVQGVGFRYYVRRIGTRLELTGDVRNLADSTVEIEVVGEPRRIAAFIKEVEKGPPMARVERVEVYDLPVGSDYGSFLIEGW